MSIVQKKKIICMSLWGNLPFYNYGAYENALLAKTIYPGWICRFYYSNIDNDILKLLSGLDNVELVNMGNNASNSLSNTFWRFLPAFTEKDIVFISRDTDSRFNIREKIAVDQWLNSQKDFHVMRDHPWHMSKIMAGMWGCRNNILHPLLEKFNNHSTENFYGVDQQFLNTVVYPFVLNNSMIHDITTRYPGENVYPFTPTHLYNSFVGSYGRTAKNTFRELKKEEKILEMPDSIKHVPNECCYF